MGELCQRGLGTGERPGAEPLKKPEGRFAAGDAEPQDFSQSRKNVIAGECSGEGRIDMNLTGSAEQAKEIFRMTVVQAGFAADATVGLGKERRGDQRLGESSLVKCGSCGRHILSDSSADDEQHAPPVGIAGQKKVTELQHGFDTLVFLNGVKLHAGNAGKAQGTEYAVPEAAINEKKRVRG